MRGVLWRYRHRFHPLASFDDVMIPAAPFRLVAGLSLEIDQGDGLEWSVRSELRFKETPEGLYVLPDN